MTQLMDAARLRRIAHSVDQPRLAQRATIPVMRWIIDQDTGRPVSHWVLAEAQASSDLF